MYLLINSHRKPTLAKASTRAQIHHQSIHIPLNISPKHRCRPLPKTTLTTTVVSQHQFGFIDGSLHHTGPQLSSHSFLSHSSLSLSSFFFLSSLNASNSFHACSCTLQLSSNTNLHVRRSALSGRRRSQRLKARGLDASDFSWVGGVEDVGVDVFAELGGGVPVEMLETLSRCADVGIDRCRLDLEPLA